MWRIAFTLAMWLAVCAPAAACLGTNYHSGIVYDDIPADTPPDAVILDVVFDESVERSFNPTIVDAQVRRVVRGTYDGDTVRVALTRSSCDSPFIFGTSGLIIGALHNGRQVTEADTPLLRQFGPFVRGEDGVWFEPITEIVDDRIRRRGVIGDFDRDGREDRAILRAVGDEAVLDVKLASRPQPITIWRGSLDDDDRLYIGVGSRYGDECEQMWRCGDEERQQGAETIILIRWGPDEDVLFQWRSGGFETFSRE